MTNAEVFTADALAHTLACKLHRAMVVTRTCRRTDIGPAYGTNKAVVVLAAMNTFTTVRSRIAASDVTLVAAVSHKRARIRLRGPFLGQCLQ